MSYVIQLPQALLSQSYDLQRRFEVLTLIVRVGRRTLVVCTKKCHAAFRETPLSSLSSWRVFERENFILIQWRRFRQKI